MEAIKKNSLRSSLMMTTTEKRKLIKLQKEAKSFEDWKKIKSDFYAEHGYRTATIQDRWKVDGKVNKTK